VIEMSQSDAAQLHNFFLSHPFPRFEHLPKIHLCFPWEYCSHHSPIYYLWQFYIIFIPCQV